MIKESVEKLNKIWPEWQEEIKRDYNLIRSQSEDVKETMNQIIVELRDAIKQEKGKEAEKELEKILTDKILSNQIMQMAKSTLNIYMSLKAVRKMEKENIEMTKNFFLNLFERAIVRIELGIPSIYLQYPVIKNEEEMLEIIQTLEGLTGWYIRKHWNKKTIVEDFMEETGCSKEISEYYGDLIERYYNDLRYNVILDDLQQQKAGE